MCRFHRSQMAEAEIDFLTEPHQSLGIKQAEEFNHAVFLDLQLAFQSALRVFTDSSLHKTHSPIMTFQHTDPEHPNPRLRFKLTRVDIVKRSEARRWVNINYGSDIPWLESKLDPAGGDVWGSNPPKFANVGFMTYMSGPGVPKDKSWSSLSPCPFDYFELQLDSSAAAPVQDWRRVLSYTLAQAEMDPALLLSIWSLESGAEDHMIAALEKRGIKNREEQYRVEAKKRRLVIGD